MTTTTVRDLGRGLLRPRFLIAAFIVTALVTMGMHRQRLLNEEVDIMRQDFEMNGKVNRHFSDAAEVGRKIQNSERLYQKQVQKRVDYIRENNANVGAWLPKAKEMMPFWWYFQPSFNCPYEVERVGRFNDGGKWMCGMTVLESMTKEDKCVIYSLGVFDDSSWEKEMIDRTKCQVYAFDASVKGIAGDAAGNPNIHFFKYFIADEDRVDSEGNIWKTLKTVMKENGHEWIDVLKIDIEGNEFAALNAMMDQFEILPFSQLQLEIHVLDDTEKREHFMNFVKFWERLESHHLRPFWSELNVVYSRLYTGGLGLSEYSFINIGGKHKLLQNL
ncbi:MAG: methyltransferase domain-containing protein [Linnemannia elongata]|nr:MAG: methyltransferase domain-containing protein [Linnemannia elongata]